MGTKQKQKSWMEGSFIMAKSVWFQVSTCVYVRTFGMCYDFVSDPQLFFFCARVLGSAVRICMQALHAYAQAFMYTLSAAVGVRTECAQSQERGGLARGGATPKISP